VNILFLSTWFPYPPDNGSKLRVYHLLRTLAKDHAVTLVSFTFDTARPEQPGDLRSLCSDMQVVPVNPFAVNRAGTLRTFLSVRPVASRPIPTMSWLVADVLRSGAFDVVIASTEMMADYALQAPPGPVRILEEHNAMTRWMRERYAEQTNPLQRLRCWASWQKMRRNEARLFNRFDLVTMVSEQDRTTCLADLPGYSGPVAVVPNGVDCQHNQPGVAQPQPNAMIYNGALTYSANFDAMRYFLADIWPQVKAAEPGASLRITGRTEGVRLQEMPLRDGVSLTGYLPDIRPAVAGAWACVVPLRMGGGTRLKILEAMALGTPVVATSKGAEGLAVTPEQDILIADTAPRFAEQTLRLLRDPGLRQRLSENGRRLVEREYSWSSIGERFNALVESVAAEGTRR
jgi:glycosyltransferase involved in cell wall biosynthesis